MTFLKLIVLVCLAAVTLTTPSAAKASEAAIDENGNIVISDDDDSVDPTIRPDEPLSITVTNESPYRVDVYFDDGEYGSIIATLEKGETTGINSFLGHKFFVTRHGRCFSPLVVVGRISFLG